MLRWMADCVTVIQDTNGNVRPVKPERGKTSKRIDGIIATIVAMSQAIVHGNAYIDAGFIALG